MATGNKNVKKRSLDEAEINNNQFEPPNKKQKTMNYSPNTMEMMINFMQNKPVTFMKQLYQTSIKLYETFKSEQLIKQSKITNRQSQKQFVSIFNGIQQSKLTNILSIPEIIIFEISQYAIGKVFVCAHNVCDKEIFVFPYQVEFDQNPNSVFCESEGEILCESKANKCYKCGTEFNINSIECGGDRSWDHYCNKYLCENNNCNNFKDTLPKCGRENCENQYCGGCIEKVGYYYCVVCSKTNIGCNRSRCGDSLFCDWCEKIVCDGCSNIEFKCVECNIQQSTHEECVAKCIECDGQIGNDCKLATYCEDCDGIGGSEVWACKKCSTFVQCGNNNCDSKIRVHASCKKQNIKYCWECLDNN